MNLIVILAIGLLPLASGCGRRQSGFKIVGGNRVTSCRTFPWAVFLKNEGNPTSCTASIIDNQFILTAAHCIKRQGRNDRLPPGDTVFAYTGNINKWSGTKRIGLRVWTHPSYNHQTLANDIAVLKLRDPIRFDDCHQAVCLGSDVNKPVPWQRCTVLGWGAERQGGRPITELKSTDDFALSESDCIKEYGRSTIQNRILCGRHTSSFCHGDSGGPFICQESNGQFYQYAVVSGLKSPGCGGAVGLYMRVSYYLNWILGLMRQ